MLNNNNNNNNNQWSFFLLPIFRIRKKFLRCDKIKAPFSFFLFFLFFSLYPNITKWIKERYTHTHKQNRTFSRRLIHRERRDKPVYLSRSRTCSEEVVSDRSPTLFFTKTRLINASSFSNLFITRLREVSETKFSRGITAQWRIRDPVEFTFYERNKCDS